MDTLFMDSAHLRVRHINNKGNRGTGFRKAKSSMGDHGIYWPGPLRALVKGARTWAVLRRNRW